MNLFPKIRLLKIILPILASSPIISFALPPLVFKAADGRCTPVAEICGDAIDQDCDGTDLLCPGSDKDLDGFSDPQDCDPSDRRIYPGVSVACTVGSTSGTKTCQTSGQYNGCSTAPLCEATGSGKCYYISAAAGLDSNPGTFASPWKTFLNITSYYRDSEKPSGFKTLSPGDVVYFLPGVYRESYFFENAMSGFQIRNVAGTPANKVTVKAYPGSRVTISPKERVVGFKIYNSKNVLIEGLELAQGYGAGLRIEDGSEFIEGRNLWIHDTDGIDNYNVAGVYSVRSKEININHSFIHDNYDRTCEDTGGQRTENSRNLVFFDGGNMRVNYNIIFQTPPVTAPKTGSCVVYKHGQDLVGGVFEVGHNIMKNCYFTGIGTATYGGWFHHNLIVDSENSISIRNHGVPTGLSGNVAEFNTIVNSIGLEFTPSQATEVGSTFGVNTFRKNIVVDSRSYNSDSGGIIKVDPYGNDITYLAVTNNMFFRVSDNCYFNSNGSTMFGYFSSNHAPSVSLGGLYNFSSWQGLGFDSGSSVVNPNFTSTYLPQASQCLNKGIFAN